MIDLDELEKLAKAVKPITLLHTTPQIVLDLIERVRRAEADLAALREEMQRWEPFLNAHGLTFTKPQEGEE